MHNLLAILTMQWASVIIVIDLVIVMVSMYSWASPEFFQGEDKPTRADQIQLRTAQIEYIYFSIYEIQGRGGGADARFFLVGPLPGLPFDHGYATGSAARRRPRRLRTFYRAKLAR